MQKSHGEEVSSNLGRESHIGRLPMVGRIFLASTVTSIGWSPLSVMRTSLTSAERALESTCRVHKPGVPHGPASQNKG